MILQQSYIDNIKPNTSTKAEQPNIYTIRQSTANYTTTIN